MKIQHLLRCVWYVSVMAVLGCAQPRIASKTAIFSKAQVHVEAGLKPTMQANVDRHCPFGMPKLTAEHDFGPTDLIARDGYVLLHSSIDKIPYWVCEYVERDQLTGKIPRGNPFAPDPDLKPGKRAELRDYLHSGYDRGHLAPAGDQTRNKELKDQTFFLSNMSPQVPELNQQIWRELEDKVRNWAIDRGSAYIITGPLFYEEEEEVSGKADGVVKHLSIGPNSVSVPTHFYKIVMAKRNGKWEEIGFVMKNAKHSRPFDFQKYIKPVRWIEERAGIDFMPEMDKLEQQKLEKSASPLWN